MRRFRLAPIKPCNILLRLDRDNWRARFLFYEEDKNPSFNGDSFTDRRLVNLAGFDGVGSGNALVVRWALAATRPPPGRIVAYLASNPERDISQPAPVRMPMLAATR